MRRRSGHRREEGAIAVLAVAVITCILVPLTMLLFYAGRIHIVKGNLQNATDAVALAAAAKIREQGLAPDGRVHLDQQTVSEMIRAHVPAEAVDGQLRVLSGSDAPHLVVRVDLRVTVDVPFGQSRTFELVSHAKVRQRLIARRWPAVVIAADVSPSMAGENFRLLREMLLRYAGLGLPVRNGLILFNGDLKTRIDPPVAQMSNIEAFRQNIPAERPSGTGSNPLLAITTARSMLAPFNDPDTQRNFILVSDGGVNRGSLAFWNIGSQIRSQARTLRHLAPRGAAIHTIFPDQGGAVDGAANWLQKHLTGASNMVREIAGGPESDGNDPEFHTSVSGYNQIDAFLRKLTEWVCSYGPMDLERDDLLGVYFRRPSGEEQPLTEVTPSSSQEGYRLRRTQVGDYIAVSRLTCYALGRNPENRLVLRWGPARLAAPPATATK